MALIVWFVVMLVVGGWVGGWQLGVCFVVGLGSLVLV